MAKLFSIVLVMSVLLAFLGLISGCAGEGGGKSAVTSVFGDAETESTGKGRYDAWASAENKKGVVIKEIEETKQKEIDLEIAKAGQVKVVLDTPEKINAWYNAQATRDLGEVAKNLSKGDAPSPYAEYFRPTPMPKSAFAEGAEVVLDGAVKLAGTPAAQITSAGYAVGQFVGGVKSGTTIHATDKAQVTLNQAKATGQSKATINNGAAGEAKKADTVVDAAHWSDCTTTSAGAATIDEVNACMSEDYGYQTSVKDGVLYLDGVPYNGPGVE